MPSDDFWPDGLRADLESLRDADARVLAMALPFPRIPPASALLRRAGYTATGYLPEAAHRLLTTTAKLMRRARTSSSGGRQPRRPLARLRRHVRPWAGRRAALLLTHDIDTLDCAAAVKRVLQAEAERELTSVVNVLTHGPYFVTAAWLEELRGRGAEIGLHGSTHDYAIGSRRDRTIEEHLRRALDALGDLRPMFYRAPAFAISPRLARHIAAAGFRCDSSRTVYHPGFSSTRSLLPFRPLAGAQDFWELPVAVEDSLLFREWRMSENEAVAYCGEVLDRTVESGGVFVLDTHPGILARYPGFYPRVLDQSLEHGDVWIASGADLLGRITQLCAA